MVPQDDFCDDEKSVKVDEDYLGESNEENDKLRFVGVREKLMPVKPSDYSSRVVPSEDISGTEDIQSLLLQQKVNILFTRFSIIIDSCRLIAAHICEGSGG